MSFLRPFARSAFGAALGLGLCCCKAKPKPVVGSLSASASASAAPAPEAGTARCRALGAGPALTVGEVAQPKRKGTEEDGREGEESEESDDEAAMLPFATRVDSALALTTEFAAGGLGVQGGKTEAFVALVPVTGAPGRRVGLGVVHGDVDPPLVTAVRDTLVIAVADMDAGGGMLRVTRLEHGAERAQGELAVTGVEHDTGAALASDEHTALLVWGARAKRGTSLKVLAIDADKLSAAGAAQELAGTADAESPLLVARPGGFWLAWVAEQPFADAGARVDAGARTDAGASSADAERLVDSGPRVLLALPLDAHGKPVGTPRAVSGTRAHVVGFALAPLAEGALALTWREDDAAPGVETGPPELARVGLDGAVQRAKVEDEELSAGLPALLADPKAGGRVWVALESASEGTRVGLLAPTGLALDALIGDRLLRGADPLAAGDGKLLVSRARGRAVELEVLECKLTP